MQHQIENDWTIMNGDLAESQHCPVLAYGKSQKNSQFADWHLNRAPLTCRHNYTTTFSIKVGGLEKTCALTTYRLMKR
jgi:hypothetical protein